MVGDRPGRTTFAKLISEGALEIGDGYRAKNDELGGDGLMFLRAGHVTDTHIDFEGVERFRVALESRVRSKMAKPGDAVVTTKGNSTGRTTYVTPSMPPFVYSPHLSYWRSLDPGRIEGGFLRYWSRGPEFKQQLAGLKASTDMAPYLSLIDQKRLGITLPSVSEQRAIAQILGTLDDKIELNRRMSETLEAMARALFKSWFVDFDPVRAKAEGRDPGLPKPLADLFPARLVDSELGEIPEGWEVDIAGSLFDVAIGKTPPRKEHQWFSTDMQDIPWMSIKDLGQSGAFISQVSEYLTHAAVERFRVRQIPDGTVVLSFKLTVGRVAITDGDMLSNEAIAHFLPRDGTFLGAAYLYCYLHEFDYESLGSTSSIATAVNSDSVRAIPVLVPSPDVHESFVSVTWTSFLRLRELERESRILAALRDTLLPMLISGEVRVTEAASHTEALT